jgi:hypothetical protein
LGAFHLYQTLQRAPQLRAGWPRAQHVLGVHLHKIKPMPRKWIFIVFSLHQAPALKKQPPIRNHPLLNLKSTNLVQRLHTMDEDLQEIRDWTNNRGNVLLLSFASSERNHHAQSGHHSKEINLR